MSALFRAVKPVIKRFTSCALRINFRDHAPPSCHLVMSDGREVWVKIDTLEISHGKIGKREIAEAVARAATQRPLLLAKFKEFQA